MKKRITFIIFFILLFASFIYVWSKSYQKSTQTAKTVLNNTLDYKSIPTETAVFKRSKKALEYKEMNEVKQKKERSINKYYKNRPYPGAPPYIPHAIDIEWEKSVGGGNCLQCHKDGGYVPKFKEYAPITPHPDWTNCRQCHVTSNNKTAFFKATQYKKPIPPNIKTNQILVGTPQFIPHEVEIRNNCLACHAGPAAPKEIKVSHPERVNCKQCHVPINDHKSSTRFTR